MPFKLQVNHLEQMLYSAICYAKLYYTKEPLLITAAMLFPNVPLPKVSKKKKKKDFSLEWTDTCLENILYKAFSKKCMSVHDQEPKQE